MKTTKQNLWDTLKTVLWEKCIDQSFHLKNRNSANKLLNDVTQKVGKNKITKQIQTKLTLRSNEIRNQQNRNEEKSQKKLINIRAISLRSQTKLRNLWPN